MNSRWLWGIAGALITTYVMSERRRRRPFTMNGNGILRKSMVEGVLQTGRSLIDRTLQVAKTR